MPNFRGRIANLVTLTLLSILLVGCNENQDTASNQTKPVPLTPLTDETKPSKPSVEESIKQLVIAEDLVLDLTFQLKSIGRWWETHSGSVEPASINKDFLPWELKSLRRGQGLSVIEDLVEFSQPAKFGGVVSTFEWPIQKSAVKVEGFDPLAPLMRILKTVRNIKFGVLSGQFDSQPNRFVMEIQVSGQGAHADNEVSFDGQHRLLWTKQVASWRLTQWSVRGLNITQSPQHLFEDVLQTAIPDHRTHARLRQSYHQDLIEATINTGQTPVFDPRYKPFVDAASPHALPSASVVDFDGDGWDDVFVTARWGPTQLLKNNGDGTFRDVTEKTGLSFPGLVNCGIFVDIDNDGDKDALIGRALEPVVYLQNDNGKFTAVTGSLSNLSDQYMVSAISAADINRDGLIDFYMSTYGPFGQNTPGKFKDSADWRDRFLSPPQKRKLAALHAAENTFVDHAGPPNLIVMNRGGGKLERVDGGDLVSQWHHSYQAAWADADGDGDDDLYVTNDFAQDAFLINETPQGASEPVFVDGLASAFPDGGIGFGMGASWGDFDNDSDLDLYVSNMYSKAGKRVLHAIDEGDPRFEIATRGNFLYENRDGRFYNITGTDADQQNVGKVGWSYGGQFADFDNNGHIDLYVPSGYYTASEIADTKVDI